MEELNKRETVDEYKPATKKGKFRKEVTDTFCRPSTGESLYSVVYRTVKEYYEYGTEYEQAEHITKMVAEGWTDTGLRCESMGVFDKHRRLVCAFTKSERGVKPSSKKSKKKKK